MPGKILEELQARINALREAREPPPIPQQVLSTYRIAVRELQKEHEFLPEDKWAIEDKSVHNVIEKNFQREGNEIGPYEFSIVKAVRAAVEYARKNNFNLFIPRRAVFFAILRDEIFLEKAISGRPVEEQKKAIHYLLNAAMSLHKETPSKWYAATDVEHLLNFLENNKKLVEKVVYDKVLDYAEKQILQELMKREQEQKK